VNLSELRTNHFPASDLLKRYISYISFSKTEKGKKEFLVFPNPGAAIALHHKHEFVGDGQNTFSAIDTNNSSQLLHTNRIDPVRVIDEGERETITIVFYPLAVNHFFKDPLDGLLKKAGGEHSYIDISTYSFSGFADKVYSESTTEGRLLIIEEFFVKHFNEKQIPFVQEALDLLTNFDLDLSIPDVCKRIGTSPRNLSRLFNKYILLSPVEFRNIAQFRFSLNKKVESGNKALKEIGYESNYADASYMVRMYKKYTGLNPSAFFEKVTVDSNYVFLSL
jgi:AraC-like DNA-binding protein